MTRSLGDGNEKNCSVIAQPDTYLINFSNEGPEDAPASLPEFIVLASDGVWD